MSTPSDPQTPPDATRFLHEAERELLDVLIESQKADWVYSTYITPDTESLSSRASSRAIRATAELAKRAATFDSARLSESERRKVLLLRLSLTLAAPADPAESEELTQIVTALQGEYARGRYTPVGTANPLSLEALEKILGKSRDPRLLEEVWAGWHAVARPMRSGFQRYVALANKGAHELGFPDTGAMWRSKYDMPADEFAREVERLWKQVEPLYTSLHAFVRTKLVEQYGPSVVPVDAPIPAHLLTNMWAQSWEQTLPILLPSGGSKGIDLTERLRERKVDALEMVRIAERFFVSLGLNPLPPTFWERSLFVRPSDREVVCHASAWDLDFVDDLRIKMCIDVTAEDFQVIHHELGHNYYQRAYNHQPVLFRDSAHDGFHEAVGDTIQLSITPEYLSRIGLWDGPTDLPDEIPILLHRALEKVAFLPFGLLVDRWRWQVFDGEIDERRYNESWWALKRRYQGVAPPRPRSESDFDPGAKYHVPANVPYMRYFLAHILQFQFHRALVRSAGGNGPVHRASIYGSHEAGERLHAMLAMGASRPWPDALEAATGERRMDAQALLDYFAPLKRWLDDQNRGHPVGWND